MDSGESNLQLPKHASRPGLPRSPLRSKSPGRQKRNRRADFELRGDRGRPGPPDTQPKMQNTILGHFKLNTNAKQHKNTKETFHCH